MPKCIGVNEQLGANNVISPKAAGLANNGNIIATSAVHKRPRGRPKLFKSTERLSETLSNASDYRNTSSVSGKHCKKACPDDVEILSTTESNGDNGRTKLSDSLTEISAVPTTIDDNELETINNSNQKRGRGRPRGSLNKTGRHSLDAHKSHIKKQKKKENLSPESKHSSPLERKRKSSRTSVSPMTSQHSTLNGRIANTIKRGKGRPPGSKNKPKSLKPKPISKTMRKLLNLSADPISLFRQKELIIDKNRLIPSSDLRAIPKHRFDEAVAILNNPEHTFWQKMNISCTKSIYSVWEKNRVLQCDHNIRSRIARQFLMRRDWKNLSIVLNLSLRGGVTTANAYYALFSKYTALSLAHTNKHQFNKFIQFLLKTEDGAKVLKMCSQFSQNCTAEDNIDE